jgi:hypothetical protein
MNMINPTLDKVVMQDMFVNLTCIIAVLSQLGFFALILTNIWQFCPSVLLTLSEYTYLD